MNNREYYRKKYWSPDTPKDKKKGCLCRDTPRYSRECCKGDYFNQGI